MQRFPRGAVLLHGLRRKTCSDAAMPMRSFPRGHLASALAPSCRGLVTAQSPKPMKRFYEGASAQEAPDGATWQVLLDRRPVRTPKGSVLELPTRVAAEAVAGEWQSQVKHVRPLEMPLTTLSCTAVDLIRPQLTEGACVERLLPFLETDTVCFEDENELLATRQNTEWGPLRQWFEAHFGVKLTVSKGLIANAHPQETLPAVRSALLKRNEWDLCAMEVATQTAKSLVVAVAIADRPDTDAEEAMRWALLEEHFQIERWGLVEGEHDVSHEETLKWLGAVSQFVQLCRARA
eukprot:TRINITY_DN4320_c0_g1_i2.p1 TRINITY_DN4320_c0_g1~~TRINITY_DN4320_c0_g1_i2.p1  ORF type:complete len:313 (-),score=55.85 TRINITY_DN4320_c0_g1_i2:53-928(-)